MKKIELRENEKVIITTSEQKTYEAVVISNDQQAIFVNFNGFGRLSIPWSSIINIEKRPLQTNTFTFRVKPLKKKTVVSF